MTFAEVEKIKNVLREFKPHALKMDIEGADVDILRSNNIDYAGNDLIFCEYSSAKEITEHGLACSVPSAGPSFARGGLGIQRISEGFRGGG